MRVLAVVLWVIAGLSGLAAFVCWSIAAWVGAFTSTHDGYGPPGAWIVQGWILAFFAAFAGLGAMFAADVDKYGRD